MSRIPEWPDWEAAQRASPTDKAISARPIRIALVGAGLEKNPTILIDLVMQRGKDPYAVYHSACGIRIPYLHYRPSVKEIDAVRSWKAV